MKLIATTRKLPAECKSDVRLSASSSQARPMV